MRYQIYSPTLKKSSWDNFDYCGANVPCGLLGKLYWQDVYQLFGYLISR